MKKVIKKLLIILTLATVCSSHAWMVINETGLNLQIEYGLRNPIKFNMLATEINKTIPGKLTDGTIRVTALTGAANNQTVSGRYSPNDEELTIHVVLDRNNQKIYLSQIVP